MLLDVFIIPLNIPDNTETNSSIADSTACGAGGSWDGPVSQILQWTTSALATNTERATWEQAEQPRGLLRAGWRWVRGWQKPHQPAQKLPGQHEDAHDQHHWDGFSTRLGMSPLHSRFLFQGWSALLCRACPYLWMEVRTKNKAQLLLPTHVSHISHNKAQVLLQHPAAVLVSGSLWRALVGQAA